MEHQIDFSRQKTEYTEIKQNKKFKTNQMLIAVQFVRLDSETWSIILYKNLRCSALKEIIHFLWKQYHFSQKLHYTTTTSILYTVCTTNASTHVLQNLLSDNMYVTINQCAISSEQYLFNGEAIIVIVHVMCLRNVYWSLAPSVIIFPDETSQG